MEGPSERSMPRHELPMTGLRSGILQTIVQWDRNVIGYPIAEFYIASGGTRAASTPRLDTVLLFELMMPWACRAANPRSVRF